MVCETPASHEPLSYNHHDGIASVVPRGSHQSRRYLLQFPVIAIIIFQRVLPRVKTRSSPSHPPKLCSHLFSCPEHFLPSPSRSRTSPRLHQNAMPTGRCSFNHIIIVEALLSVPPRPRGLRSALWSRRLVSGPAHASSARWSKGKLPKRLGAARRQLAAMRCRMFLRCLAICAKSISYV